MLNEARAVCVTCARAARSFTGRYRAFLFEPGTLVTLASGLLLIAALIIQPAGLTSGENAGDRSPLYLAAALVGSFYIWWSAIQGIRKGDFTADIPVSIATAAAIAIGQYSAAAVVAVLLLLGGVLESFVAARAGRALEALAQLLPDRVTVRRDGQDLTVALAEVQVGDHVLVRTGERVAVDGTVAAGSGLVNQAVITGESLPVEKQAGDEVYSGTLNELGALEVSAERVGADTTLGQIRRMVEAAQSQKAPIERLLDRYAKLYTPIALLLGLVLWAATGDIMRAITMLIVFCPCVMVLATPTALVAAIGNAALRGSLVKKGATIEALAKVDTVLLDKTGTLTLGEPRLLQAVSLNGLDEGQLLRLAAAAERFSEHPYGRALVRAAEERGLPLQDPDEFEALPGLGVRARVDGAEVTLGKPGLLREQGVQVDGVHDARTGFADLPGRSPILMAVDGRLAAGMLFEDTVRPSAPDALARLAGLGVQTVLITGDRQATAEQVAGELGVGAVRAEVLPQDKAAIVADFQRQGRVVAFVGDGVNDGPALATADVGVAMGLAGTDVAIETAEIALLADDLAKLPQLVALARKATGVIRLNLAFSLGVLAVAVVLTTVGILNPVTGALLHELSSIPVIMNSARLIRAREAG